MTAYDPDRAIAELRDALRTREASFGEMNALMVQAAGEAAAQLWPDPRLREAAGIGAILATASVVSIALPGIESAALNCTGLFGLALVDSARAELRTGGRS